MNAIEAKHSGKDSVHLVNRLQFEIRCPEQEQAFKLSQNFAHTLQPEIVEIMDQVCSEYVAEHEWLQIDKLELDLGRFSPNTLTKDFSAVFRDQFGKELAKQLGVFNDASRHLSKQRSSLELFCHFMLRGTLPWWSVAADTDIDAIALALLASAPTPLRAFFYQQRRNRSVWARAAFQLDDKAKTVIISLIRELQEAETRLLQWLESCKSKNIRFDELERIMASIHEALLSHAPGIIDNQQDWVVMNSVLKTVINVTQPDWSDSRIQLAMTAFGDQAKAAELGEAINILQASFSADEPLPADIRRNLSHSSDCSFADDAEIEPEQRYVVHQSGVILLAPFFRPFFDACGLLEGMVWKHKDAQYQGLHLLKYLTTGAKKSPEYGLALEKLICGIALEEPIPLEVGLQAKQMDQAHELLASVIEHWQALKNTSIDGLRGTFLSRDGLITRKNDDWLLQVERKTLDVLLDSIPWGYSTITLPWNDYLIHVEW